jgi:hypothetical protein
MINRHALSNMRRILKLDNLSTITLFHELINLAYITRSTGQTNTGLDIPFSTY